jgi:hypothetical protein
MGADYSRSGPGNQDQGEAAARYRGKPARFHAERIKPEKGGEFEKRSTMGFDHFPYHFGQWLDRVCS